MVQVEEKTKEQLEFFAPFDRMLAANRIMIGVVVVLSVCLLASVMADFWVMKKASNLAIRFISTDSQGNVSTMTGVSDRFDPRQPYVRRALRNMLGDWAHCYYSMIRNPVNGEPMATPDGGGTFMRSLLFLPQPKTQAILDKERETHAISRFLAGNDPEITAQFKSVILHISDSNPYQQPYRADIYFTRKFFSEPLQISKQADYLVSIQFMVIPSIVTPKISDAGNPYGVVITDIGPDIQLEAK